MSEVGLNAIGLASLMVAIFSPFFQISVSPCPSAGRGTNVALKPVGEVSGSLMSFWMTGMSASVQILYPLAFGWRRSGMISFVRVPSGVRKFLLMSR